MGALRLLSAAMPFFSLSHPCKQCLYHLWGARIKCVSWLINFENAPLHLAFPNGILSSCDLFHIWMHPRWSCSHATLAMQNLGDCPSVPAFLSQTPVYSAVLKHPKITGLSALMRHATFTWRAVRYIPLGSLFPCIYTGQRVYIVLLVILQNYFFFWFFFFWIFFFLFFPFHLSLRSWLHLLQDTGCCVFFARIRRTR